MDNKIKKIFLISNNTKKKNVQNNNNMIVSKIKPMRTKINTWVVILKDFKETLA